jgi:hypothetical protein
MAWSSARSSRRPELFDHIGDIVVAVALGSRLFSFFIFHTMRSRGERSERIEAKTNGPLAEILPGLMPFLSIDRISIFRNR